MIVPMCSTSHIKIIAISSLPIISRFSISGSISLAVKPYSLLQWGESLTSVYEQETTLLRWRELFATNEKILGLVSSKVGYSLQPCKSLKPLARLLRVTLFQLPQEIYMSLPERRYVDFAYELRLVG